MVVAALIPSSIFLSAPVSIDDRLRVAPVAVDDAGHLALAAERARGALAGGGAGGRLEIRLLCHDPILRVDQRQSNSELTDWSLWV